MGQEKCPLEMHARVVLGVGKGVLFREVSSFQGCPYTKYPFSIDAHNVPDLLHSDVH